MDVSTIYELANTPVDRIVDATAQALGFHPMPSEVSYKTAAAKPEKLAELADGWENVVGKFDDHTQLLSGAAQRCLDNWRGEGADAATEYIDQLLRAMNEQRDAMSTVREELDNLADALLQAQSDIDEAWTDTGIVLIGAFLLFTATLIAAALSPPPINIAIIMCFVELAAGFIFALITFYIGINRAMSDQEDAVKDAIKELDKISQTDNLDGISTPTNPDLTDITIKQDYGYFYSENTPDGIIE